MKIKDKLGFLNINNSLYQTRISSKFKNRVKYQPADPKLILSFIPGTVVEIFVSQGQKVKKGELLLILDAMKMQNRLKCPMDGKIKSIVTTKGDRVSKGALLIELE
ncbi:MAG: acetyl-CoA carboxylase biotin carboxyl carrier protein subunit [Bacteroidales bacterium]|nr:acetyl-CoA carboxylase biotin carboxyl carrier protein subunit [Bacteroidales bacterium]MBK8882894.1 acetyl-CoA carboxylase biotin carboxyl carrier protein subunit [Bacteroidales bacterium]